MPSIKTSPAVTSKEIEREKRERRETVESTAGALTGLYRPDELEQLGADWPE